MRQSSTRTRWSLVGLARDRRRLPARDQDERRQRSRPPTQPAPRRRPRSPTEPAPAAGDAAAAAAARRAPAAAPHAPRLSPRTSRPGRACRTQRRCRLRGRQGRHPARRTASADRRPQGQVDGRVSAARSLGHRGLHDQGREDRQLLADHPGRRRRPRPGAGRRAGRSGSTTAALPDATVSYGFRGPASVDQAVARRRLQGQDGPAVLPALGPPTSPTLGRSRGHGRRARPALPRRRAPVAARRSPAASTAPPAGRPAATWSGSRSRSRTGGSRASSFDAEGCARRAPPPRRPPSSPTARPCSTRRGSAPTRSPTALGGARPAGAPRGRARRRRAAPRARRAPPAPACGSRRRRPSGASGSWSRSAAASTPPSRRCASASAGRRSSP